MVALALLWEQMLEEEAEAAEEEVHKERKDSQAVLVECQDSPKRKAVAEEDQPFNLECDRTLS